MDDDQTDRRLVLDCSPRIYDTPPHRVPPPPRQYRQGDVLLIEDTARARSQRSPERPTAGRWILALGEATGHAHAIAANGNAELYRSGASRFLDALRAVELVHEEHGAITVAPGTYRVRIQREYVPPEAPSRTNARAWAAGSVRPVRD